MSKKHIIILVILLVGFTLACQTAGKIIGDQTPAEDQVPGEALTNVVEYIGVGLTQTALNAAPPTDEPPTASPTAEVVPDAPLPPPILPEVTLTLPGVAILPSPEPTSQEVATKNACRYEAYLDYETIPYGKEMPYNHRFTKVWRIRNAGNCAWDAFFELMCLKNCSLFGVTGSIAIANRNIKPGDQVEVRVDMHAPKDKDLIGKTVEATWMIRGGGKVFGIQPDGETALSVGVKITD